MGFSLITLQSPWFIILCIIIGVVFAFLLYFYKKSDEFTQPTYFVLAILRGLSVALVCFLLLSPFIKSTSRYSEKPTVILALDNSSSIRLSKDSLSYTNNFVEKYKNLAARLSKKFDVQLYSFGDKITKGFINSFSDKQTNISQLFYEIRDRYSNRNLAALVLATDGIYNQGTDPVYASEQAPYTIHTIALGDTMQQRNLVISRINYNQVTFLGNDFPVEISLNAFKLPGSETKLTISSGSNLLYSENINISGQSFSKTIKINLTASKPGVQRFSVAVSAVGGEISKLDNNQEIFVEVLDNRQKVLLLYSSPHPDVAALKQTIEKNQSYAVESSMLSDFQGTLTPYSLVILHQIPSVNDVGFQVFNQLKTNTIPVLFIIGAQSNLPAYNNLMYGLSIPPAIGSFTEATGVLNPEFSLFSLNPETSRTLSEFPPLQVPYSRYVQAAATQALMYQRIGSVSTSTPLILFNQGTDRKSATIAGEGIWKWRLANYAKNSNHQAFDELILNMVQYLAVKEDKSPFRIISKSSFYENETIEIDAELYNNSYQLVNEPEVNIEITDQNNKKFPFSFSRTAKAYYLSAGIFPPGDYSYKASVLFSGKSFNKAGVFTVKELNVESMNTVANHSLLNMIASRHQGKMLYPDQVIQIEDLLLSRDDLKTIVYTQKRYTDLISYLPFLLLLIGLLSAEWFIRKRRGSY